MKIKRIITLMIFVIVFCLIILFPYKEEKKYTTKINDLGMLNKLKKGDILIQEFKSNKNYNSFGLRYANYQKYIKKGCLRIIIKDKKNNKERIIKKNLNSLVDNDPFYINYKLIKNTEYSIQIENDSDYNITFYTTKDNDKKTRLFVNDELKKEDLILFFKKYNKRQSFLWYYSLIVVLYFIYSIMKVGDKV